MTQKQVINEVDADELYNWIAFDMLKDEKFNNKVRKSMTGDLSREERAAAIRSMFLGMKNGANK